MKQIYCRDIDGICDTPIIGRNAEEMITNRLRHLKEAAVIYPKHQDVLDAMQFMSENEVEAFNAALTQKFNESPDI